MGMNQTNLILCGINLKIMIISIILDHWNEGNLLVLFLFIITDSFRFACSTSVYVLAQFFFLTFMMTLTTLSLHSFPESSDFVPPIFHFLIVFNYFLIYLIREYLLVVLALGGRQGVGLSSHSLAYHAVKPTHLEGHDFPGIDPSIPAGILYCSVCKFPYKLGSPPFATVRGDVRLGLVTHR